MQENCSEHAGANVSVAKDGVDLNNSLRNPKRNRKQVNDPPYRARIRVQPEETRRSERIANSVSGVAFKNIGVRDDKESDSGDFVYYNKRAKKSSGSHAYFSLQDTREKGNVDTTQSACEKKELRGSVCHQCREFTNQVKSICRNLVCVSVNPQLCGSCLGNHYGEDLESALKDPEWKCPFCRGICSCSLCKRSGTRIVTRCLEYKKKLLTLSNGKNLKENETPKADANEISKVDEDHTPKADENEISKVDKDHTPNANENEFPKMDEDDTPSGDENEIPKVDEDDAPSDDENNPPKIVTIEIWDDDENKENIDPELGTEEYDPARVFEPDLVIEEGSSEWIGLPTDEERDNAEMAAYPGDYEDYATSDATNEGDDNVVANKESHNSSS